MSRRFALLFSLSVGCILSQVRIPDTHAGQALRAWLDAYNSGDRARIETFVQKFEPTLTVDGIMRFRNATGDLELVSVDRIEPTRIEFHVKQVATSKIAAGQLNVTDTNPAQVVALNFMGLQILNSKAQKP